MAFRLQTGDYLCVVERKLARIDAEKAFAPDYIEDFNDVEWFEMLDKELVVIWVKTDAHSKYVVFNLEVWLYPDLTDSIA